MPGDTPVFWKGSVVGSPSEPPAQLSRRLATNFISLSHPEDQLSLGPDRGKQEFAFNDVATPC